jgi:hypothetical protein
MQQKLFLLKFYCNKNFIIIFTLIFLLLVVVLEFELIVSRLLGRYSTIWATVPELYGAGYFQDKVL